MWWMFIKQEGRYLDLIMLAWKNRSLVLCHHGVSCCICRVGGIVLCSIGCVLGCVCGILCWIVCVLNCICWALGCICCVLNCIFWVICSISWELCSVCYIVYSACCVLRIVCCVLDSGYRVLEGVNVCWVLSSVGWVLRRTGYVLRRLTIVSCVLSGNIRVYMRYFSMALWSADGSGIVTEIGGVWSGFWEEVGGVEGGLGHLLHQHLAEGATKGVSASRQSKPTNIVYTKRRTNSHKPLIRKSISYLLLNFAKFCVSFQHFKIMIFFLKNFWAKKNELLN